MLLNHPVYWILIVIYALWVLHVGRRFGVSYAIFTLLIFSLPFNSTIPLPKLGFSLTSALLIIISLLSLWNFNHFLYVIKINKMRTILLILLALLSSMLIFSIFSSLINGINVMRALIIMGGWIVLFITPIRFVWDWKRLKSVFFTVLISIGSIAIVSLLQQFSIIPSIENKQLPYGIMGVVRYNDFFFFGKHYYPQLFGFINFSEFGIYSSIAIIIIFSLLIYDPGKSKVATLGMLLIIPIILLSSWTTQSRGVWITIAAIIGYTMFIFIPRRAEYRFILLSLTMLGLLLILLLDLGLIKQISDWLIDFRPQTVLARFTQMRVAWEEFVNSPLLGIGIRQFDLRVLKTNIKTDVHNTFISQLVSTGLLGTLPFLALWGVNLYIIINLRRGFRYQEFPLRILRPVAFVIMVSLFLESLVFPGSHNKTVSFYLGLISAFYAVSYSILNTSQKNNKIGVN